MSWDVEPAMSPPSGALSSSCRACYPGRWAVLEVLRAKAWGYPETRAWGQRREPRNLGLQSQPPHCWQFRPGNSPAGGLSWVCRMFTYLPGHCPLDTGSPHPPPAETTRDVSICLLQVMLPQPFHVQVFSASIPSWPEAWLDELTISSKTNNL